MPPRTRPRRRAPLALLLLAGTLACASSSGKLPNDRVQYTGFDARSGRFTVGAGGTDARPSDPLLVDVRRAWSLLPEAYVSLGLTPTVRDEASMIVGVQNLRVNRAVAGERMSRLVDCGVDAVGHNADYYEVYLTVLSGVRAVDSVTSTVTTRVVASAVPGGAATSIRCGSTGRLEELIATAMRLKR